MKPVEPILAENVCITNYLILHFLNMFFKSERKPKEEHINEHRWSSW